MTKKELFVNAINFIEGKPVSATPVELIEGLSHEIELLEKKAASPKKPTAVQLENESLKTEIVAFLSEADAPLSIKEIQSALPSLSELSNQRISHLLSALVNNETLCKGYVKKVPYYAIKN